MKSGILGMLMNTPPLQTVENSDIQSKESCLKDHSFLKGMNAHNRRILIDCARPIHFGPGEVIFDEGQPANRLYLIIHGEAALETYFRGRGTIPVKMLGPGETLGWSCMFEPRFRHLSAHAVNPMDAYFIEGAPLISECEADHNFGYELFKRLAGLMLEQLQGSRRLSLELA